MGVLIRLERAGTPVRARRFLNVTRGLRRAGLPAYVLLELDHSATRFELDAAGGPRQRERGEQVEALELLRRARRLRDDLRQQD